jgi:hypothetical protein
MQLLSKNKLIKAMKKQIRKLSPDAQLPEIVKEMPDDDDWAW